MKRFLLLLLIGPIGAIHANDRKELLQAAKEGNRQKVMELIERSVDLNVLDKNSNTPLMLAANNGYMQIAKALLDAGAYYYLKDIGVWLNPTNKERLTLGTWRELFVEEDPYSFVAVVDGGTGDLSPQERYHFFDYKLFADYQKMRKKNPYTQRDIASVTSYTINPSTKMPKEGESLTFARLKGLLRDWYEVLKER